MLQIHVAKCVVDDKPPFLLIALQINWKQAKSSEYLVLEMCKVSACRQFSSAHLNLKNLLSAKDLLLNWYGNAFLTTKLVLNTELITLKPSSYFKMKF